MSQFKASKGRIAEINFKLAYAASLGFIAWVIWPDSPLWWGFGVVSFLLACASAASVADALRLIRKIRAFEKEQLAFEGKGVAAKSAGLASKDRLKSGGVIRDAR